MESTGGDFAMSQDYLIREIRLTDIVDGDYMTFYEAAGDQPQDLSSGLQQTGDLFSGRAPDQDRIRLG